MANFGSITVNDGESTPVAHTFEAISTEPHLWRENITDVPLIGQGSIVMQPRAPANGDPKGLYRVPITVKLPVLETEAGSTPSGYTAGPAVAFYVTARVEFLLPSRSTKQIRKNLRVLLQNALSNSQLAEAVDDLKTPF